MAPTNEHAVATVYSTQVRSNDEKTILVEAGGFTPMRWFLEHSAAPPDEDAEPLKKRRKLRQIEASQKRDRITATREDEIPIHTVSIDFHFPDALQTEPPTNEEIEHDVVFDGADEVSVVPYNIESAQIRLTTPEAKGAVLRVDCSAVPQHVRDALRGIALPGQLRASYDGRRMKSNPATVLRCSLKRSAGQQYNVVRLIATLSWLSGASAFPAGMPIGKARVYEDYELLAQAYHDSRREEVDHSVSWSPHDFYDSVHVPEKTLDTQGSFDGLLESELYPFQKRAVSWMLSREGAGHHDGRPYDIDEDELRRTGLNFYEASRDAEGIECYVNYLQGIISRTQLPEGERLSGGLLAEEMGLGKTVELMALVASHKRPASTSDKVMTDAYSGTAVTPSKATLIITPHSILQQWKSELSRHAPSLKVYEYDGIPTLGKRAPSEEQVIRELATDYDVVLATYNTLTRELHFAEDPPDRNMRHARKFERKRSPLVQIQWWRICLDEAQMVESGVTAAARVACRLPRVHSWAVTGTPLRKNVQDLHGLLIFLRYKPLSENAKLWSHLITNHRHLFRRIWSEIALRHTKAHVREELRLPPQKRVVLTVPFSAVEQQHYSTMFTEMCEDVGLNADGSPKGVDWDPTAPNIVESMRLWLMRLRQTCLHPQVGTRNRRALGRSQGPLRTVAEVLEVMIDQNETSMRTEERSLLTSQLLRAHILGNNGEDEHRSEKALEIYKHAMNTTAVLVADSRARLAAEKAALAEKGEAMHETDDEESAAESTPVLGRLRNSLRTALQLQHACTFFAATAYFQIKSNETLTPPDSDRFEELEEQESTLYEAAKQLRKEILKDTSRKAEATMRKIADLDTKGTKTRIPRIADLEMVGIEGRRLVEKSDVLFDVIREQAQVIVKWRAKMAEYLLKPLVDEDEGVETTGEEYEASTKQQDELYVYFDAVKAMQADLNTFVTGEDATLIDHEVKQLIKAAKKFLDPEDEDEVVVHAPELLLKLLEIRNKFRTQKANVGSVRGLIHEARGLETTLQWNAGSRYDSEHALLKRQLSALQKVSNDFTKALAGLEKEIDLFRTAQNGRIEFYRQLQELSDAVAPHKEELDPTLDFMGLELALAKEEQQSKDLAQLKTKNRFLLHLRDESGNQGAEKICVICQCPFEHGVLTVCGHIYDKACIQHWWSQHRTCPVCKRKLNSVDFHNITYKPQELKAQEEVQSGQSSPGSSQSPASTSAIQSSIYSDVDSKLMDEIKSIDLPSSYGTKIDTLGRHLHWIREHDPGAKSIVFSQYREFLDVLGTALADFKIGYSRLGRNGAVEKFRHDPSVDCLLLDAKTDSSGLTLVNATHVFICEPLIQTAVELQAIARVHRIGQTRSTTIWMYLVNETVEESIYELSVARRLAHVQSRQRKGKSRSTTPAALQENAIDAANSEELQTAPLTKLLVAGKGGGELVGNDDLWQCLFGKAQKTGAKPSMELDQEVGRHLRAEAADQRRSGASASRAS